MIGYTLVGTNDLPRAVAFYDALLAEIGAKRMMTLERLVAWTVAPHLPAFGVALPYNQAPATVGNGSMIALAVNGEQQAQALHAKALALGATDEGEPGPRGEKFYCAYIRDLDGNKLNFFCMR
jgi:catechol 2,3-dioxygenase-like lactoylglutathione lyase family enzyme